MSELTFEEKNLEEKNFEEKKFEEKTATDEYERFRSIMIRSFARKENAGIHIDQAIKRQTLDELKVLHDEIGGEIDMLYTVSVRLVQGGRSRFIIYWRLKLQYMDIYCEMLKDNFPDSHITVENDDNLELHCWITFEISQSDFRLIRQNIGSTTITS